nr:hypothetical protein [uncultured Ralstonia sp.]
MNSPLPRRFYYLLSLFGVLVCILFAAATFFFPERSVERISAYFILTMGTCVLMCAIGLALTHRWIDQHFAARETENAPDAETQTPPTAQPEQTALKPAPQTNNTAADKADSQCVASTTN